MITASGGNHGLGVAYAGWLAGVPAAIYLPGNTPRSKVHTLEAWGARVIVEARSGTTRTGPLSPPRSATA